MNLGRSALSFHARRIAWEAVAGSCSAGLSSMAATSSCQPRTERIYSLRPAWLPAVAGHGDPAPAQSNLHPRVHLRISPREWRCSAAPVARARSGRREIECSLWLSVVARAGAPWRVLRAMPSLFVEKSTIRALVFCGIRPKHCGRRLNRATPAPAPGDPSATACPPRRIALDLVRLSPMDPQYGQAESCRNTWFSPTSKRAVSVRASTVLDHTGPCGRPRPVDGLPSSACQCGLGMDCLRTKCSSEVG